MTTRTWNGGNTNFLNRSAWTPPGLPATGDTLIITSGEATLDGGTLTNETVWLGGPSDTAGQYYAWIPNPIDVQEVDSVKAPDPTLVLINATIAAGSAVYVPYGDFATLASVGAVNDGTIEVKGDNSGVGGTLYLSGVSSGSSPNFTNNGTITVDSNATLYWSAYAPATKLNPSPFPIGEMANNGTIVVNGRFIDGAIFGEMLGTGTIRLDASSVLGTVRPAFAEVGVSSGGAFWGPDSHQTLEFNGGHLQLDAPFAFQGVQDPTDFEGFNAVLKNFGSSPLDQIDLVGATDLASFSFSNGELDMNFNTMSQQEPGMVALKFAGTYFASGFQFATDASGNGTIVTYSHVHHLPPPGP